MVSGSAGRCGDGMRSECIGSSGKLERVESRASDSRQAIEKIKVQRESRKTEREEAAQRGHPTLAAHISRGGRDASSPALWLDVAHSPLLGPRRRWNKEWQQVQWSLHSRSWSVGHSRERERKEAGERTLGSAKGRPTEYSPRYPPSPGERMSNSIDKTRALDGQHHFNNIDWSNRRGSTPRNLYEVSPWIQWEEGSARPRSTVDTDQSVGDTRWSNGSNRHSEADGTVTPEDLNGVNEGEIGSSADADHAPAAGGMRREGSKPRTISSTPLTPGR